MNQYSKIAVLTDGTPISDDVLGSGMCRVNTQLFRALSENIGLIVSTTLGGHYTMQDVDPQFKDRCVLVDLPKPIREISKVPGKFLETLRSENIAFQLQLPNLIKKIKEESFDWVFSPCGVDPAALYRGIQLAEKTRLPLALYLVDDFEDGAILSGNKRHLKMARKHVASWLKRADKIFVISEGLGQHLRKVYSVESTIMPLPYSFIEAPYIDINRLEKQVYYLGGLSHFYLDGLRQLVQAIDTINRYRNQQVILQITSRASLSRIKELLGNYDFIHHKPCISAKEVREEIAKSAVCFVPYSFHDKHRVMVSTSFPSKTMDYLAAGKFILVYGPEYSTSIQYFKENSLPTTISTENPELLEKVILEQIHNPKNHNKNYSYILKQNHSHSRIKDIVVNNLYKQDNSKVAEVLNR